MPSQIYIHIASQIAEHLRSDQQIVTGITILIAGFAKGDHITIYHWQMVTYLAWMSSGTHLITLSFLRIYFREYPGLRIWRICGMLVLFVMLFVAIIPTGNNRWNKILYHILDQEDPEGAGDRVLNSSPAACFWTTKFWDGWRWEGVFTYTLLVSNYAVRAGALFESSEQRFWHYLHHRPLSLIRAKLDKTCMNSTTTSSMAWHKTNTRQRLAYHTLMMVYCTTSAVLDM